MNGLDASVLNTVLLLIGLPLLAYGARVVSRLGKTITSLEAVLTGYKSDAGLVGRVEGVATRVHKLESRMTAVLVHLGLDEES